MNDKLMTKRFRGLPAQWLSELYCPVTCQHFTVTIWYWQAHCWTTTAPWMYCSYCL